MFSWSKKKPEASNTPQAKAEKKPAIKAEDVLPGLYLPDPGSVQKKSAAWRVGIAAQPDDWQGTASVPQAPRIFISTGDASGDVHAAAVVKALKALCPAVQINAVGGIQLQAELAQDNTPLLADQRDVMGKIGVVAYFAAIPSHIGLAFKIVNHLKQFRPHAVLLIDYGGFHLQLARFLKHRLFYYIPPQVWASRPGRIQAIKQSIERVFCIFPFEEPLYQKNRIAVTYVGHPLVGQLPQLPLPQEDPTAYKARQKQAFCEAHNLNTEAKLVALFPGSRKMELQYLLAPLLKAASQLKKQAKTKNIPLQVVLAQAPNLSQPVFEQFFKQANAHLKAQGINLGLTLVKNQNHALLAAADLALVASGTVTLEAALYRTPMVIVYKGSWLSYAVVKQLVRVPFLGLPNLLSCPLNQWQSPWAKPKTTAKGKKNLKATPVFPEFYQQAITPEALCKAAWPFLDETSPETKRAQQAFTEIAQQLSPQNVSEQQPETQKQPATAAQNVAQTLLEAIGLLAPIPSSEPALGELAQIEALLACNPSVEEAPAPKTKTPAKSKAKTQTKAKTEAKTKGKSLQADKKTDRQTNPKPTEKTAKKATKKAPVQPK